MFDYTTTTGKSFQIHSDDYKPVERKSIFTKPESYNIQTVKPDPNDVILVHVSENLDLDSVNAIHKELEKAFPYNSILIANEYILKGLTIIKPPKVGEVKIREADDELSKWLRKNVEFNL